MSHTITIKPKSERKTKMNVLFNDADRELLTKLQAGIAGSHGGPSKSRTICIALYEAAQSRGITV